MTFEQSLKLTKTAEGGFQSDYHDSGNWTGGKIGHGHLLGTKYGISAQSYPGEDIKNLTPERAAALYRRDFWDCFEFDNNNIPDCVRYDLFDIAVQTSAPGNPQVARVLLQRALGVVDDGDIGPITRAALAACNPEKLDKRLNAEMLLYLTKIDDEKFKRFGRGWIIRIATRMRMD